MKRNKQNIRFKSSMSKQVNQGHTSKWKSVCLCGGVGGYEAIALALFTSFSILQNVEKMHCDSKREAKVPETQNRDKHIKIHGSISRDQALSLAQLGLAWVWALENPVWIKQLHTEKTSVQAGLCNVDGYADRSHIVNDI